MTPQNVGLDVELDGDRSLVITRRFRASPERVYRAHTEPALVQQWCLGPDGWTMPVCQSDLRPGGAIRYEWRNGDARFHLTGEFVMLEPFARIVHIERMHLPDPTPDNRIETRFVALAGGGTLMTMRMTLPDAATREAMLATGMTTGMEISYQRLDGLEQLAA